MHRGGGIWRGGVAVMWRRASTSGSVSGRAALSAGFGWAKSPSACPRRCAGVGDWLVASVFFLFFLCFWGWFLGCSVGVGGRSVVCPACCFGLFPLLPRLCFVPGTVLAVPVGGHCCCLRGLSVLSSRCGRCRADRWLTHYLSAVWAACRQ